MKVKNKSISQKSTISIVILSVITGGIIALQDHFNKGYLAEQNNTYQINNQHPLAPIKTRSSADNEELFLSVPSDFISKELMAEPLDKMQLPGSTSLLFAVASDKIKPAYYAALSATATRIKMAEKGKQTVWQIVGHADHSGTLQFNLKLAKQRAQAVGNFLLGKGVQQAQLSILSLGESSPVTFSPRRTVNRLDRRVEIHHYQAEIAALAKQLNRQINATGEPHKKIETVQAPEAEQSVLAARGFGFKQNQPLTLTSSVFRF